MRRLPVLVALLFLPRVSFAATGDDVVALNDGTSLSGRVVKQEPGKFVTVRLADGTEQTVNWGDVKRVTMAPRGEQAEPPPSGDSSKPAVRTSTGEAVNFTLAPPPTYTVNFAFGGFATYASLPSATAVGGGMEFAGHAVIGVTPFPGTKGGAWQGFAIQAFLQPLGGGIIPKSGEGGGFFALNGGVGLGYSYMRINDLDLDYKQRGIGFYGTWRFGEQELWVFSHNSVSASSFAHGPAVGLTFPTYAAHRGTIAYGFVNANVVFVDFGGGGTSFYQLGGGGAF